MQRLVIGDIHGCWIEFQELLDQAGLSEGDKIIALGDFVDRGPDSPRVLDFFQREPNAYAIQGNHERKHIRSVRGEVKAALSQRITRQQLGDDYAKALTFFESLPLYLEFPEANLVHGYWEPGLAIEQQRATVLAGTMGSEKHLRENYDRPWYELYDGDIPIIVGHHDYARNRQPFVYRDRVFGIDTSCCHGGVLTAIMLPDFRFVSVPSRADYWRAMRNAYKSRQPVREPIAWDEDDQAVLTLLHDHALREHAKIVAQLRQQVAYDALSPHEQGKVYAEFVGQTPQSFLLHLARRDELTLEKMQRVLRNPDRARKVAVEWGLSSPDETTDD
ncbi:MAG: metallophosphoesterase [Chloroflexi bacterium]|nr:metallophosphoesterase [Chloroflexota bacterium]